MTIFQLFQRPICQLLLDSSDSTYYNDNNVHPKDIGYDKFGEIVSSQLCNYIKK